jgi:hypothetical protein
LQIFKRYFAWCKLDYAVKTEVVLALLQQTTPALNTMLNTVPIFKRENLQIYTRAVNHDDLLLNLNKFTTAYINTSEQTAATITIIVYEVQ